MPSKTKRIERIVSKLPSIPKEMVSHFLTGPMTGEAINAAGAAFKKALIEAALNAELSHHLGYEAGASQPEGTTNHRNGVTVKTVLTGGGRLAIETPRDRDGSFEPVLIPKHARRFSGFDDQVIAPYARGLTVREIQGFLLETCGTEVSADFISTVTDVIQAEVTDWQTRPLEVVYPVVFFDALQVKIRDDGVVCNKAVYLALGVRRDGTREILGIWIENTGAAKFWLKVFNELRNRGTADILIAVTDGLNGMEQALAAAFPNPPRGSRHLAQLTTGPSPHFSHGSSAASALKPSLDPDCIDKGKNQRLAVYRAYPAHRRVKAVLVVGMAPVRCLFRAASGPRASQECVREGELVLERTGGCHGHGDAPHAEPHQRPDLQ